MTAVSLGCFGKLPIYPDFIRFNAHGPEIHGLDQWFQEGIHWAKTKLGRNWETDFAQADPWRFVFQPDGAGAFLTGVVVPGRDQGGRQYPFILFLRIDRAAFTIPFSLSPLCADSFLNQAVEAAQTGWKGMDVKGFVSSLERLPVPDEREFVSVRDGYLRYLRSQTMEHFWKGLLGDFKHPLKYGVDQSLAEILGPLRQTSLNRFGFGLRFPLFLEEAGEGYDIPFWFDLVSRWTRQDAVSPLFFWTRGPTRKRPHLLSFFQKPSPKNILSLVRPDAESDTLCDLAAEHFVEKEILPARRAFLDQGDLTPAGFLETVGKEGGNG